MAKKDKSESDHQTPEWLRTIQLNSWEAELLVSALVLFALFQIPDLITRFSRETFEHGSLFHTFFSIITDSVDLLKLGYTLHILIRGLWVASVGLSYVFPNGINKEKLAFKGRFEKELESKKSLVNSVLRLEELSSIIYGITFLLFGTFMGFGLLIFIIILVNEGLSPLIDQDPRWFIAWMLFVFLYFIMAVLLLIDFLTNGLFRRIDWMAAWFYPVAVVFRILTLSFLYRRSLLVLVSNTKGWKSHVIPIVVVIVSGGFFFLKDSIEDSEDEKYLSSVQTPSLITDNYESLRTERDYLLATIQSDVVNEGVIRLFVRDLKIFRTFYGDDSLASNTDWRSHASDSSSLFLNRWVSVQLDTTEARPLRWFKTQHQTSLRYGYLAHVDISTLERGAHNLRISFDTTTLSPKAKRTIRNGKYAKPSIANIYFFNDRQ